MRMNKAILYLAAVIVMFTGWSVQYSHSSSYNFKWQSNLYPASSDTKNVRIFPRFVLSDGTVILGVSSSIEGVDLSAKVVAYAPDGTLKWSRDTGGTPYIAVSSDEKTVYAASRFALYAIAANGTLKWQKTLYLEGSVNTATIWPILADGTVLVSAGGYNLTANSEQSFGKVAAYAPDGTLKWSQDTHGIPFVAVSSDEKTVYVGATETIISSFVPLVQSYETTLYAIATNGTLKWQEALYAKGSDVQQFMSLYVFSDGTVLAGAGGTATGKAVAYTPAGALKWSYDTSGMLVIMPYHYESTAYAYVMRGTSLTTFETTAYAFTSGGVIWQDTIYPAGPYVAAVIFLPVFPDGTVVALAGGSYITTGADSLGKVVAYTSGGVRKWSYDTGGMGTFGLRSGEENFYLGVATKTSASHESKIYAFDANAGYEWQQTLYSENSTPKSMGNFRVLSDGTVALGAGGFVSDGDSYGQVFGFSPAGSLIWSYDTHGVPFLEVNHDEGALYATVSEATYSSGAHLYDASLYAFAREATNQATLALTKSGTGTGTVTSSPSGINCGSVCSAPFTKETSVTLTAVPDIGSTLAGWTGGGCGGTGTCTVTISTDVTVTAIFNVKSFTLNATIQGDGTVSATGLTCKGANCSGSYPYNTFVTPVATPNSGASFKSWTGCDAVNGTSCSVTMKSNRSITASFTAAPCSYTISPLSKSFANKGGTISVKVIATGAKNCANPGITASDAWIGATLTSFKNNKGSVKVTAAANTAISTRKGSATIGKKTFDVTQTGMPCTLTGIAPTKNTLTSSGGSASFSVTAATGCEWKAGVDSGSTTWFSISSGTTGNGNGTVTYVAAPNTTKKQRNGKINVYLTQSPTKKKTFTLTEKK
jgi:hypothetical protein